MTVVALSDFCGTTQPAITQLLNRISESDPITNDLSESLKPFAGKTLRLITNDLQGRLIIPDEVCSAVLEYYAFEARQYAGKTTATNNYRSTGRAGIRVFIWARTGFVPDVLKQSLRGHTSTYIERLENIRDHRVPDNLWTAFREGAEVLLLVEKEMKVPVDQMDICDGSIGRHWSIYRKKKQKEGEDWIKPSGSYYHVFNDQRMERECKAYDLTELSYFRAWLREVYIPTHLPDYLATKFGKLAAKDIYMEIGGVTDRVLEVTKIKNMTPEQEKYHQDFLVLRKKLQGREFKSQIADNS
jgi:hypothetical protein